MSELFFSIIYYLDELYWNYIGLFLVLALGVFLTFYLKGLQFRALFNMKRNLAIIFSSANQVSNDSSNDSLDESSIHSERVHFKNSNSKTRGIHPFKLYFASVGGMVGLGNIVFISMATMLGGPGSVFWIIVTLLIGMLVKYSEIYLGVKHRVKNNQGGYDGGPMYFLQKAFSSKKLSILLSKIFAVFLCIYGIEVSNFLIIADSFEASFNVNRALIVALLLIVVIYSALGGIKRLSNICTLIMPIFMVSYVLIALYIILCNAGNLLPFLKMVIADAFTGTSAVYGFAGSSFTLCAYLGISKTIYSGDIAIGYDSIVQSETKVSNPKNQALFAIYALLTDGIICIITNILVGVTDAWKHLQHLRIGDVVPTIMSEYIVHSHVFMALLFFVGGFTTIIAYLAAGVKCANFLAGKHGKLIYLFIATILFTLSSYSTQDNIITLMSLLSGILAFINLIAIFNMRKEIQY